MKVRDSNILRATAKAVISESKEKTKGVKLIGDRDRINTEIITRHHKRIEGQFSKVELIYYIGVVKGTLRDPEA